MPWSPAATPPPRQLTYALLDIERRRQAEVSIAQAQASLQRIIETAPLAIALFDARSTRRCCRSTRWPRNVLRPAARSR
jgi:PAS domain-containing protein